MNRWYGFLSPHLLQFADHFADCRLGIAEKHEAIGVAEQFVLNARVAGAHPAFAHDDRLRVFHMEHGHPEDGAAGVGLGRRVDYVIGTDDKGYIGMGKFIVDSLHFHQLVIRYIGFGEQYVHMAWHAPRDRVDGEFDGYLSRFEQLSKLANGVLRLRNGHAVTRNDDNGRNGVEKHRTFLRADFLHHDVAFLRLRCGGGLPEAAQYHVDERTVHGLAHDLGKDKPSGAYQRARDDEHMVVQDKAGGRCGNAGVRVEQGDDDGHVGAADGNHR